MKRISILSFALMVWQFSDAQNVGVGTNAPQAYGHGGTNKVLELKNDAGTGGDFQSHFILSTNGTAGSLGTLTWAAPNIPGAEKRTALIANIFESANATRMAFYTRTESGSITEKLSVSSNGHVGIGTNTPGFLLNFANTLGDKISLYGNNGNHYGFGIQSGLLQIHSDVSASNIAFGYGTSTNFTERMSILNNGNYDGMSLNGRLILKNGSNDLIGGGAGVWLYKADNSGLLGFMGSQNNQNIGFFGGPAGWGFTYNAINSRVGIGVENPATRLDIGGLNNWDLVNTEGDVRVGNSTHRIKLGIALSGGGAGAAGIMQSGGVGILSLGAGNKNLIQLNGPANAIDLLNLTGGLRINGNAGTAGQVLKSNGPGASPSWGSGIDLYNNIEEIGATSIISIAPQTFADIPGLTKTITIAAPAKVVVEFNAMVGTDACAFCSTSVIDCIIMINDNNTSRIRYDVLNGRSTTVTGKRIFSLGAGTYTFTLRINTLTGTAVKSGYFSPPYSSFLYVQTIPQ